MTTMPSLPSSNIPGQNVYLYASDKGEHTAWLNESLGHMGRVTVIALDERALSQYIAESRPRAVFLDFSLQQALRSTFLATALRRDWPELPLIGTGHATDTNTTLAALRAGVDDFLDRDGPATQTLPLLQSLTARRQSARAPSKGRSIALLGARGGLGVSTLACNLAAILQAQRASALADRHGVATARQGVALLDMGLPVRDDLLYLGLQSNFSFVDGVQNLHRLDQTLLQTALSQHASGAVVLPLPADLSEIRKISHTESVSLIQRMTEFFDVQIADLGGLTTVDFVAEVASNADKVWVVCDQSIGAIVSTSTLLRELRERNIPTHTFSLVVNRYEKNVDLSAEDVAQQLGLRLGHVLPSRSTALLNASSAGRLIADSARHDPYVQAVVALARSLLPWVEGVAHQGAGKENGWAQRVNQLLHKWKNPE